MGANACIWTSSERRRKKGLRAPLLRQARSECERKFYLFAFLKPKPNNADNDHQKYPVQIPYEYPPDIDVDGDKKYQERPFDILRNRRPYLRHRNPN
jgi:hypothetical protein